MSRLGRASMAAFMLAAPLFLVPPGMAQNPVELGKVAWHRGFDKTLEEARRVDKPMLVLFQEVPG